MLFPEDDVHVERVNNVHWWLDDRPVESWVELSCPYCGSQDFVEPSVCEECGEAFPPRELNAEGVCKECRKKKKYRL